MFDDDDDYLCSDALTRRMEAENKLMKKVKWQNTPNLVSFKDETGEEQLSEDFCMKCKHCSKGYHYLDDDLDMHLCKKYGFRTWERCWCPSYEKEGFFHFIITSLLALK